MTGLGERVEPFRALIYNQQRCAPLDAVVAPPYDLIGPELQNQLYERSPYNVVRLELNRDADRYGSSASILAQWRHEGVLERPVRPAVYLYTQIFEVERRRLRRDGLILRVRLEEFSRGGILPHERTFPAAKQDRLKLLTSIRTNVSPVFGLYSGAHPDLDRLREDAIKRTPLITLTDYLGIQNELRPINEPREVTTIQRALAESRILIADGHHRYETALEYRRRRREAENNSAAPQPYDYTMMALTACDDSGLVILPTHRVVRGLALEAIASFSERTRECFTLEEFSDRGAMRARLAAAGRGAIGAALKGDARFWILQLKKPAAIAEALPAAPGEVRELDVSILHALVLDRIFGLTPEQVRAGGNIEYTIDARAALEAVAGGTADAAFLMNPPSIGDVERVSAAGATMPEKSTYFYPKLLTGLVMNPLDDERREA